MLVSTMSHFPNLDINLEVLGSKRSLVSGARGRGLAGITRSFFGCL
jgi:hypothetical protein